MWSGWFCRVTNSLNTLKSSCLWYQKKIKFLAELAKGCVNFSHYLHLQGWHIGITWRVDTLGSLSIVLHSCCSRHFFLNPQDIHLIESNKKLTPNFLQDMKLCILYFSHWFLGSTRAKQGFSMWYRVVHIPKFPNRQLYRSLPNLHIFFYRNVSHVPTTVKHV